MKHTQGPWMAERLTPDSRVLWIKQPGAVGYSIATLIDDREAEANACLIAAAPELLEELEFLVNSCVETESREYSDGGGYELETIKAGASALKRIRKVIARAKGEE